jgi:hypothetical protein
VDVQGELRVVRLAVKIGEVIYVRYRELQASLDRVVVGSVLPRRKYSWVVAG